MVTVSQGLRRQEIVLKGAVVAAAGYPDVAALQPIAQRGEDGGLVEPAICCAGCEDQFAPSWRQERRRGSLGQDAGAVAVHRLEQFDSGQDGIPWRARLENERIEEAWAEPAQDRIALRRGDEDVL